MVFSMDKGLTQFLKFVLGFVGIMALAFCIYFYADVFKRAAMGKHVIYPFVICAFGMALTFFAALFQIFKLLRYIEDNRTFSKSSVIAVKNIKYCAFTISGLLVLGILSIMFFGTGDRAGYVAGVIYITFASMAIAAAVAVCERVFRNAAEIKSENDLTV